MNKSPRINIKCIINQMVYRDILHSNLERYLFLSEKDLENISLDLEVYLINILKNKNREWNKFDILDFLTSITL